MVSLPPPVRLSDSFRTAILWRALPTEAQTALEDMGLSTVAVFASAFEPTLEDSHAFAQELGIHPAFALLLSQLRDACQPGAQIERNRLANVRLHEVGVAARLKARGSGILSAIPSLDVPDADFPDPVEALAGPRGRPGFAGEG